MMRRLALCAVLLLSAAPAAAQGGGMGAMGNMGGMGMGPALEDSTFRPTLPMLTGLLALTPDQTARITPLRDSLLAATRPLRDEARTLRAAMQQARQAGAGPDSMAALRTRMQAVMQGLMPARLQFHDRVRALLTPEQAGVFDAHHDEMMGSMGRRMNRAP